MIREKALFIRPLPGVVFIALVVLCAAAVAAGLLVGHGSLANADLRETLLRLRGGRSLSAFVAGAALGVAGVLVQGLFRNPLASPSILGTTAGAALGGKVALLAHGSFGVGLFAGLPADLFLPIGCTLGALGALVVALAVARVADDLVLVLLAGFLLSSLLSSFGGLVSSLAQERWELARAMLSFSLGDVSGSGFRQVALVLPLLVTGLVAAWTWSQSLDVMLSGVDEARSLGVNVGQLRTWCVAWTAALTAAAVAVGGNVTFVGLVVPHALRSVVGLSHARLVPACALGGGTFVVVCDVMARAIPSRSELPLGVITGLIGGPVFFYMLLSSRRRGTHA